MSLPPDLVEMRSPSMACGCDDLLVNKRAVGRPQDRRDVRAIERTMLAAAKRPRET